MTMRWAVVALSFTTSASGLANEIDALVAICDGCHGINGVSEWADMPSIAGISEFVHGDALIAYQDSARPCEQSTFRIGDTSRPPTNMCVMTRHMSAVQIEALAAYYAAQPFVPAVQEFDKTLAEQGAKIHQKECEICHSDGGANPEDDASIIKGQWTAYMRRTFSEYAHGTREQPGRMKEKMDALDPDAIDALIHFYASPN